MGLNETPSAERVQICFFGRRNAGKSSVMNAVTGQKISIVSDVKGTTTDPVKKAMELLPLGPVVMTDTAGLDDTGELGKQRVEKTYQMLNQTDIAVLVIDGSVCADCCGSEEQNRQTSSEKDVLNETLKEAFSLELSLLSEILKRNIQTIIVINKIDLLNEREKYTIRKFFKQSQQFKQFKSDESLLFVSAKENAGIHELKEALASLAPKKEEKRLVGDLLETGDFAVLVIPIDSSAPKGRLILPQQQVIRDCLEAGAVPVAVRETELKQTLALLGKKPKIVITDSQAFKRVAKDTPSDIYLTSFSILLARYKGDLKRQVNGAYAIKELNDNDTILISEGCTHHRQCGDIGTVKLPRWISDFTKKELKFEFTSGVDFPADLSNYALVVHCGGCTLNEREMKRRIALAEENGVPMTNYGMAIACVHGILERSMEIFEK